ncbi:4'-phosphopantetheinyl transferase superfamily protein [uncultured Streptomyces sp.]|uniref:4'-phosphopantetheinyl transferase family protein n=1 Tax=uncultured Streptomyces sp. TaxID=174707 RepID=UPI0026383335|nr:4'-phosphopantetheinyl transferase family protein [uncultured Streptomyces sp.]
MRDRAAEPHEGAGERPDAVLGVRVPAPRPVAGAGAPTVAVADTRTVLALPGAQAFALTPAETLRLADARTEAARADFVAAHFLARLCTARRTGGSPLDVVLHQRCPDCDGPHGRPRVAVRGGGPAPEISLSYAGGVVAAAAADHPVGIDVERLPRRGVPGRDIRALRRFLTPGEAGRIRGSPAPADALLRTWVRKEALVKATGDGLPAMAGLDLSDVPCGPSAPGRPYRIRVPGSPGPHDLTDLTDVPPGVVGAVAVAVPDVPYRPCSPAASGMRSLRSPGPDEPIDTPSDQGDTS